MSVVVGARLGLSLYIPHKFSCGAEVVCKKTPDRMARHHDLNYIVCRAFISAGIPSSKEPTGPSMHSGPELSAFEPVTDTEIDACYLQCHPTRHHSTCCHAVCSRAVLMCSHRSEPDWSTCHFKLKTFHPVIKIAQNLPLLKKAGLDTPSPANYRPISNLLTVSKVLKRLVLAPLPHLLGSTNFSQFQSAYRKGTAHRLHYWKSWTVFTQPLMTSRSLS